MSEDSPQQLYQRLEKHYFGPQMDEAREIAALPNILKGAKVFVDIGASLGQYTYHAYQTMTDGVIYAIEADPLRFERLQELCADWAQSGRNRIVPMNLAISDQIGRTKFSVTDADRSGGLFAYDQFSDAERPYQWREVEVESATLDNLFKEGRDPDLVKVDVEGAEYRVFLGSRRILERGRTRFLVELHPWGDPTIGKRESDVFDLFAGFQYDFKRTHHHWLFTKSTSRTGLRLRNKLIHVVLDHPSIRGNVRRFFRGRR